MKAMYIVGEDMALVDSNANYVHEVLSKLGFSCRPGYFLFKNGAICGRYFTSCTIS